MKIVFATIIIFVLCKNWWSAQTLLDHFFSFHENQLVSNDFVNHACL
jgi:hypothetical protein